MDKVAGLPANQRRDLFAESSARRGLSGAVVEKDFWVCWALKRLFEDDDLAPRLIFKGGTSLSKVYGLIERFSEDIDLILDWRVLGNDHADPPEDFPSRSQRDRFITSINKAAVDYIATTLVPQFRRAFGKVPGVAVGVDTDDPHVVNLTYPRAFDDEYIRPVVCLEIGPLASWVPFSSHEITPYAAIEFPDVFSEPVCRVSVTTAERTFWEKATILHQQAHQPRQIPPRYSRHYYDLYRMASSDVCDAALKDLRLLADVVEFKERFYPSGYANYQAATPGTFRLVPADRHSQALANDYKAMTVMIFGEAPTFEMIVAGLRELEDRINAPAAG